MPDEPLDAGLLDAVTTGRAVLFLGAGASFGAKSVQGQSIPLSSELKRLLATKFLGPGFEDTDFKTIYDFAASKTSVREVPLFLYNTLSPFQPAQFHQLLCQFVWAGLLTTNYDLVVERAYAASATPLQELVTIRHDSEAQSIPQGEGKLLYVKLHGCITDYQIVEPPLIASTEQIIHHKQGRAGQFAQFLEWSRTKTIIFVGYAMGDTNLRTLFDEIIREGDNRPRHFIIRPNFPSIETQYWSDRRVKTCSMPFQLFLDSLDKEIRPDRRKLALIPSAYLPTSFSRFISVARRTESGMLLDFFSNHCEHVSVDSSSSGGDAKKFYQGFNLGWYPLERSLDVPRRINGAILNDQILSTAGITQPQFAVLKAHAGAGKSVAIRRIAWDAAKLHGKLVFYVTTPSGLSVNAFEEIISLTNQTVYLFIDDLSDVAQEVDRLFKHARSKNWRLVMICAARVNEWNTRCETLHSLVDEEYELKYLSPPEIDGLLTKLEENECLGFLASLSRDSRRQKLQEEYGRQLLVALHEATKNKSFRDIIRASTKTFFPLKRSYYIWTFVLCTDWAPPFAQA
jgi:SIR2-like domain